MKLRLKAFRFGGQNSVVFIVPGGAIAFKNIGDESPELAKEVCYGILNGNSDILEAVEERQKRDKSQESPKNKMAENYPKKSPTPADVLLNPETLAKISDGD